VGRLDAELLSRVDAQGVSVARALYEFGAGPELPPRDYFGYLEMHIEQGPVLESLGLPLGVVAAIVGQTRAEVCFRGAANHAGTTPMHLRHDAMAAAARWIALVERTARVTAGAVATVGSVQTLPGAGNVIAGEVRATLDVRHADDRVREALVNRLRCTAEKIAKRRGLHVEWSVRLEQAAVACSAGMTEILERAVEASGHRVHRIVSGAGHDAMVVASIAPIAMLFLRSPGGVSHHPDESVREEDVDAALVAGAAFLQELEAAHAE
jgi:allantoate deiminase